VGLLDASEEAPESRVRRYLVTALAFIVIGGGFIWYKLRYHQEKTAVYHFLNAVVAGNMDQAYRMWGASESYTIKDFVGDWGPDGYYGPVKSFNVRDTYHPPGGSTGVVIIVDVSPYQPFPDKDDALKQSKSKEVRLWVQFSDRSIQFPPPQYDRSSWKVDPGFLDQHHGYVAANGIDPAARDALEPLQVGRGADGRFADRADQKIEKLLRNGHQVSPPAGSWNFFG
jgi:hypothetical protein